MFEKKQYIYSDTMGVCKVADIVKLSAKKEAGEGVYYYHLKSVSGKAQDAYIPVEHHEVLLRELISADEAGSFSKEELEKMPKLKQEEIAFVLKSLDRDKNAEKIDKTQKNK